MSPTQPSANSAPPWLEFPLGLRPYQWQSWRLPLKAMRQDYATLRAFASAGQHAIAWSADAADPPTDAIAVPNTSNRWQFTLGRAPADLERLGLARLKLTGALPQRGQWRLNGQRLYTAANSDFSIQWGATAALTDGANELELVCPADDPSCSANNLAVTALRAPVLEPLAEALGTSSLTPSESADFWFDTRSEVAPRQGVWALVELADPAKPTMLRWNDGEWLQVQHGVQVTSAGPNGGPLYRVPLAAEALRSGSNLLQAHTAPCVGQACPQRANVLSARLVREISEDDDLCLASPEQCANQIDDNCDGETDDTAAVLCDGDDWDGCATGRLTCADQSCQDDQPVERIPSGAVDLQMQVTRIDGVFADGSIVPQPFNRSSMHIGRLLTTGATVQGLSIALPPSGNQQLTQFIIRGVDGGARLPWPQASTPGTTADRAVELRSRPGDNGRDLTLEFRSGTWVGAGQPIVIVIDNSPDSPGLTSLYGCADGRITFPSRLWARNACEFEGVNCAAATGPGAPCDAGPAADPIWGDRDGCATGHLLQSGTGPDLLCMGDWPADQLATSPDALQLTVTGVTWLWEGIEPLQQPLPAPVNVDLWATLAHGGPLGPLTVPAQADTARLLGVRLHVAAAEVSGPGLPSSPHAVVIGSGPEDSGQEIDLLFAAAQTATAGQPLALAADASQQPAYHAVWYCTADRWTIARLVQVVWAGL